MNELVFSETDTIEATAVTSAAECTPLTLDSDVFTAQYTYTWAEGINLDANGNISSGYYDVNKTWDGDNSMCWAASASNLLAWWQATYDTYDDASETVASSVEDIFNIVKDNWMNEGGTASFIFDWWLTGNTDNFRYEGDGSAGGYYSACTNISLCFYADSFAGYSANAVSTILSNGFKQGGATSISIAKNDGSGFIGGHAITLWGITQDAETGYLTALHVTDSDDNKDGILTVDVTYDAITGYYKLHGSRFENYYLRGYDTLEAFNQSTSGTIAKPTSAKVQATGNQAVFSWTGISDADGLLYEVAYWLKDEEFYTSCLTDTTTLTLNMAQAGTYSWMIRTTDGLGNASDWTHGTDFTSSASAPQLSLNAVQQTATGNAEESEVTFSWSGDSGATYTLTVNGTEYHAGTNTSYTLTLPDAIYDYYVTATVAGTSTTLGGSFLCDTAPPDTPSGLSVQVKGGIATFSWDASHDANGISHYGFVYFQPNSDGSYEGIYDWKVLTDTYALELSVEGYYQWSVCAFDNTGKQSSWTSGSAFRVDLTAPTLSLKPHTESKTAEGKTSVTFSWAASGASSYTLTVGGETYTTNKKQYTVELADGTYSYTVTATDTAGNSTTKQGEDFKLDTTPPQLTLHPPTQTTVREGVTQVTFSWSCNESATYELTVDGVSYTVEGNTHSLELADGTHSYSVKATDGVTLSTSVAGEDFTTSAVAPHLESTTPAQSNSGTISWVGEAGASYTVRLDGKVVYEGDKTDYTPEEMLSDGTHSYVITAVDAAGNRAEITGSFTFDSVAPALSSTTPGLSNSPTLSWEGEAGATYTATIDGEAVYEGSGTSCSVAGLSEGTHRYSITATDAAGNATTVTGSFTYDITAPAVEANIPTLTNDNTLRWSGEEGALYTVVVDGKTLCENISGNEHAVNGLSEGKHTYSIIATDAAGNETTVTGSFTYDTTPPKAIVPKTPKLKVLGENQTQVTFSWSTEKGMTYTIEIGEYERWQYTYGAPMGVTGSTFSTTLEDGEYCYRVTATDAAGNSRTSGIKTFAIDTIAPEIKLEHAYFYRSSDDDKCELDLSWYANDECKYTVTLDGKVVSRGGIYASYYADIKDGAHEYTITATDAGGNKSNVLVGSVYFDNTPPSLTVSKPQFTNISRDGWYETEVSLSWKGELGASYSVVMTDEDGRENVYSGADTSCIFTITQEGEHTITVIATDATGNRTEKTAATYNVDLTPPSVKLHDVDEDEIVNGKVRFFWDGEEGATYTLYVDGKKVYSGKNTEKTVTLKSGLHSYYIIAKDVAGNSDRAVAENNSFEVPPSYVSPGKAPALTLTPAELKYKEGKDGACVYLRWQSPAAERYELTVKQGNTIIFDRGFTGRSEYDIFDWLDNGTYSYTLVAIGYNGKRTTKKGAFKVNSKLGDYTAPKLSVQANIKVGAAGSNSTTISWKANEKGCTYTVKKYSGNPYPDILYVGTATKYSVKLSAGRHSYEVTATDKAGNVSSNGIIFIIPEANVSKSTLSWEGVRDAAYTLKVDGKETAYIKNDGNYSFCWDGYKDGKHSYTITTINDEGDTCTISGSFVADNKAPKVTLGKPKTSKAGEGLMNATLSWKGEKGATYTLTVDGEAIELSDPSATSYTLSGLADGTHRYQLTATDAAGNTRYVFGSFSHDATAPDFILGSISGTAVTSKGITRTKVTFSWVGEEGVSYTVMVNGKKQKVSKLVGEDKLTLSTLSVTSAALCMGLHQFTIIAKDKAGNVSTRSGWFSTDNSGATKWIDWDVLSGCLPDYSSEIPTDIIPADTQELVWGGTDTAGISSADVTDAANGYSFELEEARQLIVKLDGLSEDAMVILQQSGGQGSISLAANGAAGLDRELSLSAGTYYLQVLGSDGASALSSGYTLDLELEKNGKKQPLQQATLASGL